MVFERCPRIPHHMVVYRGEGIDRTDKIFKLKKGDHYIGAGYTSTTINPFYRFGKTFMGDERQYDNQYDDISSTKYSGILYDTSIWDIL